MRNVLLVVESPNKIAKLKKLLPGVDFCATVGHFQDLPTDELGVDVDTWTPHYQAPEGKASVVSRLRAAARGATLILATDDDREGEAIAWHVRRVLGLGRDTKRLRLGEVTESVVNRAYSNLTVVDENLVDAQQARRIVDRFVGWKVAPLLNPLGRYYVGRVQSATLHLVVDREKARESFSPVPYWILKVLYAQGFAAQAAMKTPEGKWLAPVHFTSEAEATAASEVASSAPHRVESITKTELERRAPAPFITSTLMRAASSQLHLDADRTMAIAQRLFETGAITYHRTDSPQLSPEGVALARDVIAKQWPDALPETPPTHRAKATAQAAHEAIRPTGPVVPEDAHLTDEEAAVFSLIARRFLASQCRPAVIARTTVITAAAERRFLAHRDVVLLHGFLRYATGEEETEPEAPAEEQRLPALLQGQPLSVARLATVSERTQPPRRFTAADLVKEMESTGIGRPSTYARTIGVLAEHGYVTTDKRLLVPTQRGRLLDEALAHALPRLVTVEYTAKLEAELDRIAQGKVAWKAALTQWYVTFSQELAAAPAALAPFLDANRTVIDALADAPKPTGKRCPLCAAELLLRRRRDGKGAFLACSAEKCDFIADPNATASRHACPKCQGPMLELEGDHGRYARCARRSCEGLVDLARSTAEKCPRCQQHPLKERGKALACGGFPDCTFKVDAADWAKAKKAQRRCSKCSSLMVTQKGPRGRFLACVAYPKCTHTEPLPSRRKHGQELPR